MAWPVPDQEAVRQAAAAIVLGRARPAGSGAGATGGLAGGKLAELLTGILVVCTAKLAERAGPTWAADPREAEAVAGPLAEVIEAELGVLGEDPWTRLLVACSAYALPRLLVAHVAPPPEPEARADSRSRTEPADVGEPVAA